ncbi:MAG: BlaI/MecI/CopY family transcriptional regulator [Gammaproteobacteria bacterium]|nr:BlaI/MecI/CopY family transcriptional regulator [Gammaproteobacteria bacterium]
MPKQSKHPHQDLSRRERQIMDVLYRHEQASVTEIAAELPDPPTETAIRTHLRILEDKGQVRRQRSGRKHIYRPRTSRRRAAKAALAGVLETFFDGSLGEAVAAHLADPKANLDADELKRLRDLIKTAGKNAK